MISDDGCVSGEVRVPNVVINGLVEGDVYSSGKVELAPNAKVKGNLHYKLIEMVNDTAFSHAMHLHGTHFREIGADGTLGPWRDTLLIQPGETREIGFVAENSGDWMFHCHMPAHQMSGMMNWIRVS